MGVGDGVFVEEAVVFFDESLAEFGGSGGFLDGESFGFAGEYLAEIGDAAADACWPAM